MDADRSPPGDTKAGTLVGVDKFGNKFYENMQDELPRMFRSLPHFAPPQPVPNPADTSTNHHHGHNEQYAHDG